MPGVRVIEQFYQRFARHVAEFRQCARRLAILQNAVQPPAIAATREVEVLLDFRWQTRGVLDRFAVHVDDVQAAIGAVRELHGAEPVVFRRQKLTVFVDAICTILNALGERQFLAMDEVAADIGHERQPFQVRRRIAAINRHAGGTGEIPRCPPAAFDDPHRAALHAQSRPHDSPRFDRAGAKHFRLRAIAGNARSRGRGDCERVACEVAIFVHHLLHVIAVRRYKFMPVIVEAHAVLGTATRRPQRHRTRIEVEIAAINIDR